CSSPLARASLSWAFRRAVRYLHSFPTRRSSDLQKCQQFLLRILNAHPRNVVRYNRPSKWYCWGHECCEQYDVSPFRLLPCRKQRSEEHTSELQSREKLVCRLLLEKKKKNSK